MAWLAWVKTWKESQRQGSRIIADLAVLQIAGRGLTTNPPGINCWATLEGSRSGVTETVECMVAMAGKMGRAILAGY